MCVILSVSLLQIPHSGVSLVSSIEYLMVLTRRDCSWATQKRLSVTRLSSLCFSHSHLFLSSVLSISLKNWPWRAFSFHLIRRCFLLSCLFWTFINFLSFSSVVTAMTSFSLLLRTYSAKFSLSSLTQPSMLSSPLPISLLGRCNRSTFDLRCSPPYLVIIFLVFCSISFTSSFFDSVPALYQTVGTGHVLIIWNTWFTFNFGFNVTFNLLKYSSLMCSFISSWHISPFFKISRYLYPSSPIWPISSASSNSIPLYSTSFPLFIAKASHLSIPDFITMSFVTIYTVLTRLSISF